MNTVIGAPFPVSQISRELFTCRLCLLNFFALGQCGGAVRG